MIVVVVLVLTSCGGIKDQSAGAAPEPPQPKPLVPGEDFKTKLIFAKDGSKKMSMLGLNAITLNNNLSPLSVISDADVGKLDVLWVHKVGGFKSDCTEIHYPVEERKKLIEKVIADETKGDLDSGWIDLLAATNVLHIECMLSQDLSQSKILKMTKSSGPDVAVASVPKSLGLGMFKGLHLAVIEKNTIKIFTSIPKSINEANK
jgi:hypothetical protein